MSMRPSARNLRFIAGAAVVSTTLTAAFFLGGLYTAITDGRDFLHQQTLMRTGGRAVAHIDHVTQVGLCYRSCPYEIDYQFTPAGAGQPVAQYVNLSRFITVTTSEVWYDSAHPTDNVLAVAAISAFDGWEVLIISFGLGIWGFILARHSWRQFYRILRSPNRARQNQP